MSQQAISIYRAKFKTTEGLTRNKGIIFLITSDPHCLRCVIMQCKMKSIIKEFIR